MGIIYDEIGKSTGSAVIHYDNPKSALNAVKEYNLAELDGRVLRLKIDDWNDLIFKVINILKFCFLTKNKYKYKIKIMFFIFLFNIIHNNN